MSARAGGGGPRTGRRWIALLRAINVGGHTVRMEELRALFERLGCTDVTTFIASGNVSFTASGARAALERRIERQLRDALGYDVATFLRAPAELARIAAESPYVQSGANALCVAFLHSPPAATAVRALLAHANEVDEFHVQEADVYWQIQGNFGNTTFSAARLEKVLGMAATVRSMNTVQRLAVKYPAG